MRVVVTGGRTFTSKSLVLRALVEQKATEVIHGGASGADALAASVAKTLGLKVRSFPANWAAHGLAAGPMRNRQMLIESHPDLVIAFPGGRGTAHCVNTAVAMGIPVIRYNLGGCDEDQNDDEENTPP